MAENGSIQQFLKDAAGKRLERATPRQRMARQRLDARNAVLQERGVKPPKSGIFGGKAKER